MIETTVEEHSGVQLVRLRGRLDREGARLLQERLDALLNSGVTKLVLDFNGLESMAGAGLQTLWLLLKRMRRAKGKLVLCCLPDAVLAIMDVAGFCSLFHIVQDESGVWNEF
ncbi:MAG: STAS domain-containing protein [Deltaproteobacteria bacterium]|nr:STAS domain-containing protein [Deltaproteobacteria bacterium]